MALIAANTEIASINGGSPTAFERVNRFLAITAVEQSHSEIRRHVGGNGYL